MANIKSVDSSLWWDPFSLLLTELENAPLSSDLPPNLVNFPRPFLLLVRVYMPFFFNLVAVCIGEEVEGQSCLVRKYFVFLQASQCEFEAGFEFTASENWVSPVEYTARVERSGFGDQFLFGEFFARFI